MPIVDAASVAAPAGSHLSPGASHLSPGASHLGRQTWSFGRRVWSFDRRAWSFGRRVWSFDRRAWCFDRPDRALIRLASVKNSAALPSNARHLGGRNAQGVYDGLPRVHVEYATTKNGQTKYRWDERDGAFVANPFRHVRPGQVVPVSVLGGAQVEHLLTIFQSPTGDWWIAFDSDLLGYYPASLFKMLNGGACTSAWYAEVYNPHPDPNISGGGPVKTEMGSGKFAAVGRPNVAYVRKPEFYDTSWFSVVAPDVKMQRNVPSCYTCSSPTPDPVSGDTIFTFGGPGGKDPGCQWPFP